MGFLDRIFARPTVIIYVDEGDLVFDHDGGQLREAPLLRVASDGKIIAVGRDAESSKDGQLIRLFAGDGETDKAALRSYCRYHIMLILSASSFGRPRVEIIEPTLSRAFGPRAAETLVNVLGSDGFEAEVTYAR